MWPVTKTDFAISTVLSVVSSSMKIVLPATYLTTVSTNFVLHKTDSDIVTKVKRLSGKTQQRLYKRASEQINALLKTSLEKLHQIHVLIEEINKRKEELHNSVAQEYSNTLDVIKKNNPFNLINHSQIVSEALRYSKSLKNVVSSSTSVTLEYMLNNALNGLDIVNDNLFKLQNYLQQSRPESIAGELLVHTSTAVTEIRIALDSFIYHMKQFSRKKFHGEEMTEMHEMCASTDESYSDSDE